LIRKNKPEFEKDEFGDFKPEYDSTDPLNEILMYKYRIIQLAFEKITDQTYTIDNINVKIVKSFIGPYIN
jgi:hypothetical protein